MTPPDGRSPERSHRPFTARDEGADHRAGDGTEPVPNLRGQHPSAAPVRRVEQEERCEDRKRRCYCLVRARYCLLVRVTMGGAFVAAVLVLGGCTSASRALRHPERPMPIGSGIVPAGSPRLPPCGGQRVTPSHSHRIWAEVMRHHASRLLSTAICPGGPVAVQLDPGQEHLARLLLATYGRSIAVSVGLSRYQGTPGRSPRCGVLPRADPMPQGLHITLRLRSDVVGYGDNFKDEVDIVEDGSKPFDMDLGQPLNAWLVRRGTRRVVGVYAGGILGTGYVTRLKTGHLRPIPIVGGTARCDGEIGSALPPGVYNVVVLVAPEESPYRPVYEPQPVALRILGPVPAARQTG